MQRCRFIRARRLGLVAGAIALVLVSSRLWAQTQTPGERRGPAMPISPELTTERAPRLLSSPTGEILRLTRRPGEFREGGSGVSLAAATAPDGWRTILEIAPTERGVTAQQPDVAAGAGGKLAVAYQWRRHMPRSKQIRVATSGDGGKTWLHQSAGLEGSEQGFTPKVAWGKDRTLVLVWEDERRRERTWDIYARRSLDGGATWEAEQMLSRFPTSTNADLHARTELTSDGDSRFWAVWVGLRSGRSRLFLSRSTDAGRTWADPVELSGQSQSVFAHRIVRAGERLLVVWQDTRTGRDRIYAVSSTDGGATWTEPARVDHLPDAKAANTVTPSVVLSATGEALVAWSDGRNGRDDIFVSRSTDGGRTWEGEDVRLDMDEPGIGVSTVPSVARAEDGRVAVAWEDDRVGYEGIYLRVRGTGNRPTWSREVLMAGPGPKTGARAPSVTWGKDGRLHVAWETWDYTLGPLAAPKQVDGRTITVDAK